MVVGNGYGERVIVQFARDKRAYDKIWSLERLVDRGRLVNTPGDWFKVSDIKDPGIFAAVPTNGIERVKVIAVATNEVAYFHPHFKIAPLGMRFQFFGTANVTFTIGRVL